MVPPSTPLTDHWKIPFLQLPHTMQIFRSSFALRTGVHQANLSLKHSLQGPQVKYSTPGSRPQVVSYSTPGSKLKYTRHIKLLTSRIHFFSKCLGSSQVLKSSGGDVGTRNFQILWLANSSFSGKLFKIHPNSWEVLNFGLFFMEVGIYISIA